MEETARDALWDYGPITRAFSIAAGTHKGTARKGSDTPYLSHVLAVAELVMVFGGDATETAAALLHDVVEDGGGKERLAEIGRDCGPGVAAIVESCSDSLVDTTSGQDKQPWLERKRAYIEHLASPGAAPGAVLVSACDKLHNLTSTADDFEEVGDELWRRFKTGWAGQVWYYRQLLDRYRSSGDARVRRVAERIGTELGRLEQELREKGYPVDDMELELSRAVEASTPGRARRSSR